MTPGVDDVLSQINTKTTKADLMDIITGLADKLRGQEKQRVKKLGQVEKRIREAYKPGTFPSLKRLIISAPDEELKETYTFLTEFEDLLPPTLQRFRDGLATLLKMDDADEALEPRDDEV